MKARALVPCCVVLALVASVFASEREQIALAQRDQLHSSRRPARGAFASAVLDRAARTVPTRPCDEVALSDSEEATSTRTLTPDERVHVLGRVLALPDGRAAAVVRVATGNVDANHDLAFEPLVVVLEPRPSGWELSAVTVVDTGEASFHYEEPVLRVARLEDIDDDGEVELMLVLATNTETFCGTGYCYSRRSVVLDVGERQVPVVANLESELTCQSSFSAQKTGTVQLRDANADGHRDLVLRTRRCPEAEEVEEEDVSPPCDPPRKIVRLWQSATDRYGPPRVVER